VHHGGNAHEENEARLDVNLLYFQTQAIGDYGTFSVMGRV